MAKKRYYDSMDSGALGNSRMPKNVIQKNYSSEDLYLPEMINDGLSGIEMQKQDDHRKTMSRLSKSKY